VKIAVKDDLSAAMLLNLTKFLKGTGIAESLALCILLEIGFKMSE
jgi:hypothetical protein